LSTLLKRLSNYLIRDRIGAKRNNSHG